MVRETKFAKSRLVPVLDSTRDALQHYLGHRKNLGAASDNLFVLSGSKSIGPNTLTGIFIKLARATGLRGRQRRAWGDASRLAASLRSQIARAGHNQ